MKLKVQSLERSEEASSANALADSAERHAVIAMLFAVWPIGRDREIALTLTAYEELTHSIPLRWLAVAIRRLASNPSQRFLPTPGELRLQAATEVRRSVRLHKGVDPDHDDCGYDLKSLDERMIETTINLAREAEGLPPERSPSEPLRLDSELAKRLIALGTPRPRMAVAKT